MRMVGLYLALALAAVRGEDCLARRSEVVADCDWDAYERENPDVKAVWGDDDYRHMWYRRHYLLHGRGEGRRCARAGVSTVRRKSFVEAARRVGAARRRGRAGGGVLLRRRRPRRPRVRERAARGPVLGGVARVPDAGGADRPRRSEPLRRRLRRRVDGRDGAADLRHGRVPRRRAPVLGRPRRGDQSPAGLGADGVARPPASFFFFFRGSSGRRLGAGTRATGYPRPTAPTTSSRRTTCCTTSPSRSRRIS